MAAERRDNRTPVVSPVPRRGPDVDLDSTLVGDGDGGSWGEFEAGLSEDWDLARAMLKGLHEAVVPGADKRGAGRVSNSC